MNKRFFKPFSKCNCLIFLSKISAFNKQCYEFKRVYFILVVLQAGCISEPSGELVKNPFRTYPLILNFQGCCLELHFFTGYPRFLGHQ